MKNISVYGIIAAALLLVSSPANAVLIDFNWTGSVGNNPTIGGFGNSGWFFNGSQLVNGTVISFKYSLDSSTTDTDASATAGRFTGGQLNVRIDSLGVNLTPTESYDLRYLNDSTDSIFADPTDGTGWAILSSWSAATNPWQDVNQLSPLASYTTPLRIIGTSSNSSFVLPLTGGNLLSTNFTEQLANPTFSATVPEPSSIVLWGIGLAGFVSSRRRKLALGVRKSIGTGPHVVGPPPCQLPS